MSIPHSIKVSFIIRMRKRGSYLPFSKKIGLNASLFKEFPKARFMPSNGDCKIIYKVGGHYMGYMAKAQ